jgi:hypothetical protein
VPGDGFTPSGPEAVLYNGQVNLIVWGADNKIYHKVGEPGVNSFWDLVGGNGTTFSTPSAAGRLDKLYIVVQGTDAQQSVHLNVISNSWNSFSGWNPLGGSTNSGPTIAIEERPGQDPDKVRIEYSLGTARRPLSP